MLEDKKRELIIDMDELCADVHSCQASKAPHHRKCVHYRPKLKALQLEPRLKPTPLLVHTLSDLGFAKISVFIHVSVPVDIRRPDSSREDIRCPRD